MAVPEVVVDGVVFPPVARPPGSAGSHFLGGAGASRCVLMVHSRGQSVSSFCSTREGYNCSWWRRVWHGSFRLT
jgi:hypothetical protein